MNESHGLHPTYSKVFKRNIDFNQKNIAKYVEEIIKDVEKDQRRRKISNDYRDRFEQLLNS
jgi:hypothetical protein